MSGGIADGVGKVLTIDDLVEALDRRERLQSNVPKVNTFYFNGERVSEWLELVEQTLVGLSDAVKFRRILKYVLHGHHQEVYKVINATNDNWARFKDGMQRKYRLGDGLLMTADLEAMIRDDEFKKKARKVPKISEEAQLCYLPRTVHCLGSLGIAESWRRKCETHLGHNRQRDRGREFGPDGTVPNALAKAEEEEVRCDLLRDKGAEKDRYRCTCRIGLWERRCGTKESGGNDPREGEGAGRRGGRPGGVGKRRVGAPTPSKGVAQTTQFDVGRARLRKGIGAPSIGSSLAEYVSSIKYYRMGSSHGLCLTPSCQAEAQLRLDRWYHTQGPKQVCHRHAILQRRPSPWRHLHRPHRVHRIAWQEEGIRARATRELEEEAAGEDVAGMVVAEVDNGTTKVTKAKGIKGIKEIRGTGDLILTGGPLFAIIATSKVEPTSVLLGKMEDLWEKVGKYQQKLINICEEVKEWRANIPKVFLYESGPESVLRRLGYLEVATVGSVPRSGMTSRPPTSQGRMAQPAQTRGQSKASASREPPRREPAPDRRKKVIKVEEDDDEEEQDDRLRQEEDRRVEQRAKKRGVQEEAEPILRDATPKKKKYAVRLEEGFDVENVIDRLFEGHNDLVTLKEILTCAPKLRNEPKGRLSRRLVPNVYLGVILPKKAEWAKTRTKMDWKCVAYEMVDLVVKGSKCAAMVDTGAEMNIIKGADALRFGLEIDRSDCGILHGANCKVVFCRTILNVLIEIGRRRPELASSSCRTWTMPSS
ncbi:hypothetical protein CBR_g45730 [Chara braunii]|uniref:Peptidase A2 domain-containing protein n=1 Tax=Chara braunii TaxID=69332 RepID=A0A388LZ26_CHABU|nr:hypothetical protein CBR_g45730 [Chara braunii]|eukprot:GBG87578.1 hypothetical protein CBR_g45730 [Chara braunii]